MSSITDETYFVPVGSVHRVARIVEEHLGGGDRIGRQRPLGMKHAVRGAGRARGEHDRAGGVGIAGPRPAAERFEHRFAIAGPRPQGRG